MKLSKVFEVVEMAVQTDPGSERDQWFQDIETGLLADCTAKDRTTIKAIIKLVRNQLGDRPAVHGEAVTAAEAKVVMCALSDCNLVL